MNDQHEVHPTQLPVVQPDPALREGRPGVFRVAATLIGGAAIVLLVLYGMTRPVSQPQMATTETTESAAPAQPAPSQPPAAAPATTGPSAADRQAAKPAPQGR